jgi:hypothetical protein
MERRLRLTWMKLLWLGTFVASVLVVGGCVGDVDRDSYVERNEAIRKSLPIFPGATMISTEHSPNPSGPDGKGRIVSYGTIVDYRVHAGTRPKKVAGFYERRLKGWRIARSNGTSRWFVRGNASIALSMDDLLPNVRDNSRGKGGRVFTVVIDHDYYGTQDEFH